jgi:hypothetical protein
MQITYRVSHKGERENMKNHARNALIALLALMFIVSITRFAKAVGPSINLPPGTVNATFNYPGSNSYWTITLSNVPSGYDVTNGAYTGWCNDETHYINNGETLVGVTLYSSYDQSVYPGDWNRVNYIINHPQGLWQYVQDAIWYYIDGHTMPSSAAGIAMVNDANANGGGFEPAQGQLLAVVVWKAGYQTTFIEVIVPAQNVQLTITSAHDSPTPTSGSYTPGTSITASVTPVVAGPTGTQYVCTGWTGTGDVLASGTGTTVTFTITQDSSISWNWKTQYYLTVNDGGHGTAMGQGWYDAGTTGSFSMSPTAVPGSAGTQYVFTGWSSSDSGGYTGSASSRSVTMNNPITETANWKIQYYLTVTTGHDTATGQGWYDSGSAASSSVTSPVNSGHNVCSGWTGTGSASASGTGTTVTFTITQTSTITWNWYYASVGGEWVPITLQTLSPINALQLLAPWIALALIAAATAVATYRRFVGKHW